jgi:aflatoxin B1 aldehyde reductase
MTIGEKGKNGVRNHDPKECQEIIDTFVRYRHTELDTARMYAEGTTEPVSYIRDSIRGKY